MSPQYPGQLALPHLQTLRTARIAVAAIFCTNGAMLATWIARIPDIKQGIGLSDGTLGLALWCAAVGALLAQPIVGGLLSRISSRRLTLTLAVLFGGTLVLPGLATSLPLLMGALFLLGATNGGLDVSMNAQAALVEQRYGRSIMSSFHGLWSVGGLLGASLGGVAAAQGLAVEAHFVLIAISGLGVFMLAARSLLSDAPDPAAGGPMFALPGRALLTLGVIAFAALLCEGAVADWSGVYLRDALGSSPGIAATGYAAFALLMAIARLAGDRLIERLGARLIVGGGGVLIALGTAFALLSSGPVLAIVGFAAVGAGVACIFPLLLSRAAKTQHQTPGAAIAAIATAGYSGFLVGAPLIGALAELVTLRGALLLLVGGGLVIGVLGGRMRDEG